MQSSPLGRITDRPLPRILHRSRHRHRQGEIKKTAYWIKKSPRDDGARKPDEDDSNVYIYPDHINWRKIQSLISKLLYGVLKYIHIHDTSLRLWKLNLSQVTFLRTVLVITSIAPHRSFPYILPRLVSINISPPSILEHTHHHTSSN